MPKFLVTRKSHNRVTGPIMVTTSPRNTCPTACPLRKSADTASAGGCYAEHGFLGGFIWSKLDQLSPGDRFKAGQMTVYDLPQLLEIIRSLPKGSLWRHNQAGDLYSEDQIAIDERTLFRIVDANRGRRGFTYTHYDVRDHLENRRLVKEANRAGFTINLSANSLDEADVLAGVGVAPVTVLLPGRMRSNFETVRGRKVVICPAVRFDDVTCATCGICAKQRKAIVGLPVVGAGAARASLAVPPNVTPSLGRSIDPPMPPVLAAPPPEPQVLACA